MDGILSYGCATLKKLPPHKNMGMEIHYVSKGVLHWQVDGRAETLYPGSVMFTLPWQSHGSTEEYDPGNMVNWILFELDELYKEPVDSFGFRLELGFSEEESREISRILCSADQHTWHGTVEVAQLITLIYQELNSPGLASEKYVWGLLRTLIIELARIISARKAEEIPQLDVDQRLRSFLSMLNSEYSREWTLDSMAESAGLHRTQFSQKLKMLTGDNPVRYLNRIRVNHAKTMLEMTDKSVTEIAFECGFNSSQYFARIFKRFTDITPKAYRNEHKTIGDSKPSDGEDVSWRTAEEERYRLEHLETFTW